MIGMKKNDLEKELQSWLGDARKIVVVGIGNPLRRDDFVGNKIVQGMKDRVPHNIHLVECEFIPEDYIQNIADFEPTHVLVIDAAVINQSYGTVKLIKDLSSAPSTVSTHTLPLQIFCGLLKDTLRAKVALLAIQPKSTSIGEGLSAEVQDSGEELSEVLIKIFSEKKKRSLLLS
jgi:hydrogenase 3 maturation protease